MLCSISRLTFPYRYSLWHGLPKIGHINQRARPEGSQSFRIKMQQHHCLRTAALFQRTNLAVAGRGKVDICSALMDPACCLEVVALGADASFTIPGKVST